MWWLYGQVCAYRLEMHTEVLTGETERYLRFAFNIQSGEGNTNWGNRQTKIGKMFITIEFGEWVHGPHTVSLLVFTWKFPQSEDESLPLWSLKRYTNINLWCVH